MLKRKNPFSIYKGNGDYYPAHISYKNVYDIVTFCLTYNDLYFYNIIKIQKESEKEENESI